MKWTFPQASAAAVEAFLAARAAALRAIRGDDGLIIEGRDLRVLRPAAQAYAEAYRELLAWQLRQAERGDEAQRAARCSPILPRCWPLTPWKRPSPAPTAPGGPWC